MISKLIEDLRQAFSREPIPKEIIRAMLVTGWSEQKVRNKFAEILCGVDDTVRYYAKYGRLPTEAEQRIMWLGGFGYLDNLITKSKDIERIAGHALTADEIREINKRRRVFS